MDLKNYKKRKDLKSAQHHWWPRSLSEHWSDDSGKVGRIDISGSTNRIPHAKLGRIGNAHLIKLGKNPEELTPWDENFEGQFEEIDNAIPSLVEKMNSVVFKARFDESYRNRFVPVQFKDDKTDFLLGLISSLAVRSPRNREASVALAEHIRGTIAEPERRVLIGSNMRNSLEKIYQTCRGAGKFVFLQPIRGEFIFGDGFAHSWTAVTNSPLISYALAPILPRLAVAYYKPTSYVLDNRYYSFVLSEEELETVNHSVQVHSKDQLFFKSVAPDLDQSFLESRHLVYTHDSDPIRRFLNAIPGVDVV